MGKAEKDKTPVGCAPYNVSIATPDDWPKKPPGSDVSALAAPPPMPVITEQSGMPPPGLPPSDVQPDMMQQFASMLQANLNPLVTRLDSVTAKLDKCVTKEDHDLLVSRIEKLELSASKRQAMSAPVSPSLKTRLDSIEADLKLMKEKPTTVLPTVIPQIRSTGRSSFDWSQSDIDEAKTKLELHYNDCKDPAAINVNGTMTRLGYTGPPPKIHKPPFTIDGQQGYRVIVDFANINERNLARAVFRKKVDNQWQNVDASIDCYPVNPMFSQLRMKPVTVVKRDLSKSLGIPKHEMKWDKEKYELWHKGKLMAKQNQRDWSVKVLVDTA